MLVSYVGSVQYHSQSGQFHVDLGFFYYVTRTVLLPPHTWMSYSRLKLRHSGVCNYCAAVAAQRCWPWYLKPFANLWAFPVLVVATKPHWCSWEVWLTPQACAPFNSRQNLQATSTEQLINSAETKPKSTRKKIVSYCYVWKYHHPRAGMLFSVSISLMFCTSLNLYPCFWIVWLCCVLNQFLKEGPKFQMLIQEGDL